MNTSLVDPKQRLDIRLVPGVILLYIFCLWASEQHLAALGQTRTVLVVASGLWLLGLALILKYAPLWFAHRFWAKTLLLHSGLVLAFLTVATSSLLATKNAWAPAGIPWPAEQKKHQLYAVFHLTAAPRQTAAEQRWSAPAELSQIRRGEQYFPLAQAVPVWLSLNQPLAADTGEDYEGFLSLHRPPEFSRIQAFAQLKGSVQLHSRSAPDIFAQIRQRLNQLGTDHRTGVTGIDEHLYHLHGKELIASMIAGDTSKHSPQLREEMKITGLSHLSAVSGANCALVFGASQLLLRRLRLPSWAQFAGGLVALYLFVQVVGYEPSVMRAATMGMVGAIAVFSGRGRRTFPLLMVACIGLLCYDPLYSCDMAFQLSVAASAGIILFATPISKVFQAWVPSFLAQAIAMALAAHIATIPILGPATGQIPAHAVLANVLVTPLVPFVTLVGTASLVFLPLAPALAAIMLYPVGFFTTAVAAIGHHCAQLPGAVLPWPQGPPGYVAGVAVQIATLTVLTFMPRLFPSRTLTR